MPPIATIVGPDFGAQATQSGIRTRPQVPSIVKGTLYRRAPAVSQSILPIGVISVITVVQSLSSSRERYQVRNFAEIWYGQSRVCRSRILLISLRGIDRSHMSVHYVRIAHSHGKP